MANRFYLQRGDRDEGYTPNVAAGWGDSSILKRARCNIIKEYLGSSPDTFDDSDESNKDIVFRQHHSPELEPGKVLVFPGGGEEIIVTAMIAGEEHALGNNMYPVFGMRILGNAESTYALRKTIFVPTRGDAEWSDSAYASRINYFTAQSGNYTTVAGDRLVIESGSGGDPSSGFTHRSSVNYQDDSDTDFSQPGQTAAWNPWVEIPSDYNVYAFVSGSIVPQAMHLSKQLSRSD